MTPPPTPEQMAELRIRAMAVGDQPACTCSWMAMREHDERCEFSLWRIRLRFFQIATNPATIIALLDALKAVEADLAQARSLLASIQQEAAQSERMSPISSDLYTHTVKYLAKP